MAVPPCGISSSSRPAGGTGKAGDRCRHSGRGAIQFTAVGRDGRESGSGASGWLGAEGYERLYFRRYIKFVADYDQGNSNHVGGSLAALAGADRYRAMGSAGIRPKGDDHFNSAFEPWCDWHRFPPPGYMFHCKGFRWRNPQVEAAFDRIWQKPICRGQQAIQPSDYAWPELFRKLYENRATYCEVYAPSFTLKRSTELAAEIRKFDEHIRTSGPLLPARPPRRIVGRVIAPLP